jgi:hypothetical protein
MLLDFDLKNGGGGGGGDVDVEEEFFGRIERIEGELDKQQKF